MASVGEAPAAAVAGSPYRKLAPGPGRRAIEVERNQRARIHRAMVELVAEIGYGAVTARGLAARAGVSTRTFYERFKGGKEECFLETHDALVRGAVYRITRAQAGQCDPEERLRATIAVLAEDVATGGDAARFVLIESYAGGCLAVQRAQRVEGMLGAMLLETLVGRVGGPIPEPLMTGIVMGLVCRLRSASLGRSEDPSRLAEELVDWVLSCCHRVVLGLSELDRRALAGPRRSTEAHVSAGGDDVPGGDREAIFAAVTKLAGVVGYAGLTARNIRAAAGIPRRRFDDHFDSVDDCVVAAFEAKAESGLAKVARARASALSPGEGVCLAISALCEEVEFDQGFASLCFVEAFAAGTVAAELHDRFIADLARAIGVTGGESTSAIWGVLRQRAAVGGVAGPRHFLATLTYLALASQWGPEPACAEIKNIFAENLIGVS